jgi:hypothetical protein
MLIGKGGWPGLLILCVFTNTVGAAFLRVFCEEPALGGADARESEMPARGGFDHISKAKSNGTRSISAFPCKKSKNGAPSVGMVHARIAARPQLKNKPF